MSMGSAMAVNNPSLKPSFADLTWYSNSNAVKQHMIKKGYVFQRNVARNKTTDSIYLGKIMGLPVIITTWFNDKNQLVKTSVVVDRDTSGSGLYPSWNTIKDNIDAKYGNGVDLSDFDNNLASSNTLVEYQLKSGKSILKGWLFPTYSYVIELSIDKVYNNNDSYYVSLSYESPAWSKEVTRRNNDSDF